MTRIYAPRHSRTRGGPSGVRENPAELRAAFRSRRDSTLPHFCRRNAPDDKNSDS